MASSISTGNGGSTCSFSIVAILCKIAVTIIKHYAFLIFNLIPVDKIGNLLFHTPNVLSIGFLVLICDPLNKFSAGVSTFNSGVMQYLLREYTLSAMRRLSLNSPFSKREHIFEC